MYLLLKICCKAIGYKIVVSITCTAVS